MDVPKLTLGARIAAASGVALLIVMFLPWYGVEVSSLSIGESANAWEVFSVIDIVLFLAGLIAVAVVLAKAVGALPALPAPAGTIIAAVGALALVLVVYRLVDSPAPGDLPDSIEVSRKVGLFLGLLASAGIGFGGYTLMNEER
jgi:hypothetical protein